MGPSDSLPPARSGYLFPVQAEASRLASGPRRVRLGVSVSFFPSDSGFILYGSLTTLDLPFEAVSEFAFATARTFASRGSVPPLTR